MAFHTDDRIKSFRVELRAEWRGRATHVLSKLKENQTDLDELQEQVESLKVPEEFPTRSRTPMILTGELRRHNEMMLKRKISFEGPMKKVAHSMVKFFKFKLTEKHVEGIEEFWSACGPYLAGCEERKILIHSEWQKPRKVQSKMELMELLKTAQQHSISQALLSEIIQPALTESIKSKGWNEGYQFAALAWLELFRFDKFNPPIMTLPNFFEFNSTLQYLKQCEIFLNQFTVFPLSHFYASVMIHSIPINDIKSRLTSYFGSVWNHENSIDRLIAFWSNSETAELFTSIEKASPSITPTNMQSIAHNLSSSSHSSLNSPISSSSFAIPGSGTRSNLPLKKKPPMFSFVDKPAEKFVPTSLSNISYTSNTSNENHLSSSGVTPNHLGSTGIDSSSTIESEENDDDKIKDGKSTHQRFEEERNKQSKSLEEEYPLEYSSTQPTMRTSSADDLTHPEVIEIPRQCQSRDQQQEDESQEVNIVVVGENEQETKKSDDFASKQGSTSLSSPSYCQQEVPSTPPSAITKVGSESVEQIPDFSITSYHSDSKQPSIPKDNQSHESDEIPEKTEESDISGEVSGLAQPAFKHEKEEESEKESCKFIPSTSEQPGEQNQEVKGSAEMHIPDTDLERVRNDICLSSDAKIHSVFIDNGAISSPVEPELIQEKSEDLKQPQPATFESKPTLSSSSNNAVDYEDGINFKISSEIETASESQAGTRNQELTSFTETDSHNNQDYDLYDKNKHDAGVPERSRQDVQSTENSRPPRRTPSPSSERDHIHSKDSSVNHHHYHHESDRRSSSSRDNYRRDQEIDDGTFSSRGKVDNVVSFVDMYPGQINSYKTREILVNGGKAQCHLGNDPTCQLIDYTFATKARLEKTLIDEESFNRGSGRMAEVDFCYDVDIEFGGFSSFQRFYPVLNLPCDIIVCKRGLMYHLFPPSD